MKSYVEMNLLGFLLNGNVRVLCVVEHQLCRVVLPSRQRERRAPPQTVRGLRDDTEHRLLRNHSDLLTSPCRHKGMWFYLYVNQCEA